MGILPHGPHLTPVRDRLAATSRTTGRGDLQLFMRSVDYSIVDHNDRSCD